MKIKVYLKDPDGFSECVDEEVRNAIKKEFPTLDEDENEDEFEALVEKRLEKTWGKLKKWVEYQEYVMIEFDTENGTAEVVKLK